MPFTNQAMSFESDAFPGEPDKFLVTSVTCKESLSQLFHVEIELLAVLPEELSAEVDIDLSAMLQNAATLKLLKNNGDINEPDDWRDVTGVLRHFEQLDESSSGWGRFRAVLVPKLWQATRTKRSRVFENKTIEALITDILTENTLTAAELDVTLNRAESEGESSPDRAIYPQHENLAQYEESDWHFMARHLENEGVFFFFQNDGTEEKVVFADETSHYLSPAVAVAYQPDGTGNDVEEIRTFFGAVRSVPAKIAVRQYNWTTTTVLTSELPITGGTGDRLLFHESFLNQSQGDALAAIRAEEIVCGQRVFSGTSNARSFRPGMTVTLSGHYRGDFDGTYVLTRVVHTATQQITTTGRESANVTITGVTYENTFTAIPSSVAFRPKRRIRKPRIEGLATGEVVSDSADNRYAVLDADGRYLVTMEYDTNATKVKRWVRMSQPSSGPSSGMHFPINPGAEVVLAHIDGDPDRPIIVGAVPNPDNESPTNEDNVSANAIQTRTGNMLNLDDDENASGFFQMDSSRSKVSDKRRRGIQDPLASFTTWVAAQASGSGNPEAVAPRTNGASNEQPTTPHAPRQTPAQEPGSGSGMAASPAETTPSLLEAWRAFFDGDAMRELADKGPYRPSSSDTLDAADRWQGMTVSDAAGLDLPNTHLSEANVVRLLNHVARAKTDSIDADGSSNDLTGKARDLILKKAQNFEGSAAGSTVTVDIGDNFIYSLGDKFEYGDGSNSISIGTGGFTREETRGAGDTEVETWGKQTSKTTHHGTQSETTTINGASTAHTDHYDTDTSFTYRGGATATCQVNLSVQTNTEVFLGGYNCNTVNIGAFLDVTVFLIGKVEIEISGAILLTIKLGNTAEFEMNNSRAVLNSNEVFLSDMKGALKVTEAALQKDEAALAAQQAALDERTAAVNSVAAAVMMDEASVSAQAAYVTEKTAAIAADQAALTQKSVALSGSQTALSDIQTAAFHSMQ
tara:strand:+ start:198 stop:3113 length:2916 start_codon:yes stop_codon:yes gene_type:complete